MSDQPGGEQPTDDPFEGWVLDDEFVKGAFRTEHSAEERIERMQRIDADLRRKPDDVSTGSRRRRRRLPRWWWAVALLVALVVAVEVRDRRAGSPASSPSQAEDVFRMGGRVTSFPPPPVDLSPEPLGTPRTAPSEGGPFAFLNVQPSSDEPVAFDPCRPVTLVVDDRSAPNGSDGLLQEALDEVSTATGLRFVVEGETTEPASSSRRPVQVDRYGDRWAPVLVTWAYPDDFASLEGDVAGVGGGQAISRGDSPSVYVTGMVVLDAPGSAEMLDREDGRDQVRAILMHELGHLVGLDHVDDPSQLMSPVNSGDVVTFQSGDLAGLALLGAGNCVPEL